MIKKSFEPVFLGFLACVLIVTATYAITRYSVEVGAQEQKAALTAAKHPPDASGWREPTLREYDYRENAERYAQELRAM